ncbi:hypothetical protein PZA11_001068 [Diplocarpon coronariae]|uniref:DUF7896 domain-containing protein n=1 Tax=Diplocarpon coronariae TaxID=2795749 RepID=A0A218YS00_9HELO|nr:hypothetical protein B2J93_1105 [Marssonina coronariae]
MSTNLRLDTLMGVDSYNEQERRRQVLLAKRAALDAELALLPSTSQSSYQPPCSPIHKRHPQRRISQVPRSMSNTGVPAISRNPSSDRKEISQRPRALSQRSASSMARANSRSNPSPRTSVPFTPNGAIPAPLHSGRENHAIMDWVTQEQPYNAYTYSLGPPPQRSVFQLNTGLEQVPELEHVGENPSDFIRRTMGQTAMLPSVPLPSAATINNHRASTGPFNMPTPLTPTSDCLTTATTLTSDMSRQNSLCNGLESMQMKYPRNDSCSADLYHDQPMYDQVTSFPSSHHSRRSSDEEQSQLLVGTGASHESHLSHSFQFPSSASSGEKMEKSQSNESTFSSGSSSSSSSSSSRNVKRLQDQINLAAARPLMPKGGDGISMSRETSSQSMGANDGLQDRVAISKPTYQRPKHERVYCKQCDSHQEGFRGEHELRRHVDREHKLLVKKFICVEPKEGNHPKPIVPLSRCKACTQQQKKYGAYYNAAAHLRRAHFNPKSKGRSKTQPRSDVSDKRGGKGGGDYPPMSELKFWMRDVEERVAKYPTEDQQDAADASDEEALANTLHERLYNHQATPSMSHHNFDEFLAEDAPIINVCSAANITCSDIYGMPELPLDLPGADQQAPCMDPSMYQNNFTFFSDPSPNDPMAFLDNPSLLSQSCDDFGVWN